MRVKKQELSNGMEEKNLKIIEKILKKLLKAMGFECKIKIKKETRGGQDDLICDIEAGNDSNFLIGQYGANLRDLQHIARLIVRKKINERVRFTLDVNSYRQQKNQMVAEQAHSAAQQAVKEKKAVIMAPMSAYERRIVHLELVENEQVVTDSTGERESRKVIVRPT